MILPEELKRMSQIDVSSVNPDELVDVRDVQIDKNLNDEERIEDYIEKIKNPYVYKYGDYIVKLEFDNESGITLNELLEEMAKKIAEGMTL
ncbi:hypothetical protein SAMN02746066_00863 [Anaerosporobacter mobilis DSM 15930]|jgi:hypothetical protein|uniref:DUF6870 domain-containing protein n=1 Tax=Anaerosporobacter mobilis DSM 15930 TaxID=1120996 RepID=A0A1M7G6Z9_9FIRM|nr:hypothetical protein [Anaerosporobacter mobilis]SHM11858.1 hypothetical protein SAMN02746066_00863 [Anaerosporobacter mobilis DSM 15930]